MVFNKKSESQAQPVSTSTVRLSESYRPERQNFPNSPPAPPAYEPPILESVIGNDLSIEGETITIRCKGSLKILGNIQADLHSKRLEVGKEAVINGAIAADTVNVFGRVNGAILGARVVLHAGADVEGDILSQLLSVEEGANFDGRSRRVTNLAEIAPQLERPAGSQNNHSPSLGQELSGSFGRPATEQSSSTVTQLN
jgi:cytoskeletal protein CcmA (bactofilin family)